MTDCLETKAIAARFSSAARTYEGAARLQAAVAAKVLALTDDIPRPNLILEIGCGTGLLTRMLADRFPVAFIHATDIAGGLVAAAGRAFAGTGRVAFSVEDGRRIRREACYDLAVSSSSFHWMGSPAELFRGLRGLLNPAGWLVFSMMLDGTLAELHESRRRVSPHKPVPVSLPDSRSVLAAVTGAGFRTARHETETVRVDYPSAAALLHSLHDLGVTAALAGGPRVLLNRRELGRLVADYDARHAHQRAGVFATYRILYMVCAMK